MKKQNLLGQTFGRLLVVDEAQSRYGLSYWKCKCDCGNHVEVARNSLKKGTTKSCGCLQKELASDRMGIQSTKHGESSTRLYGIWNGMLKRCYTKSNTAYPHYGGQGITVCQEWHEFLPFKEWALSNGYSDDLTIDRKESNKDYSPDNCRWATQQTQLRNRNKIKKITSSTYIGVSWKPHVAKWVSYVTVNKNMVYLGLFDDEIAAAKARDKYILDRGLQHFKMNFPGDIG